MKKHSKATYDLLKGKFEFTAEVALRHHYFGGEQGYPKKLPKHRQDWSKSTQALQEYYARILSIIDFYDSASTRENDKFGEKRLPTKEEVKELLLQNNNGMEFTINSLYDKELLGNDEFFSKPVDSTTAD